MRMDRRAYAVALTLAAGTAVLLIASLGPRAERPGATAAPSSSPQTAAAPRILFAQHVVLDRVPGAGAGITEAFDAFVLVSPGRQTVTHRIGGVAGNPVFDGRDRVAYWRRASLTPSPLALSGPYEVVVWDVRTERERVLLTLRDERSNGELLWSADRRSLVVPTRTAPGSTSTLQNRLILVDAETGAMRVLNVSSADAGIGPLFVDAQLVIGVRGNSYVVLDATSGAVRTQTPVRVPGTFMGEWAEFVSFSDGTVVELLRRFESDSGPLRIWDVRDPSVDIAKVDQRGIWDPVFWPGRTEVVFSGATGLMAVDYRTGVTRQLVSSRGVHRIVAIESAGRYAVGQTESGLQIFERTGDDLRERPDLSFASDSLLRPIGVFLP